MSECSRCQGPHLGNGLVWPMFEAQEGREAGVCESWNWHKKRLKSEKGPEHAMELNLGTPGSHLDLGFQRSLWLLRGESVQRESSREAERGRDARDGPGQRKMVMVEVEGPKRCETYAGSVSGKEFSKDPKFRQGNKLGRPTLITTGHACVSVCVWGLLLYSVFQGVTELQPRKK